MRAQWEHRNMPKFTQKNAKFYTFLYEFTIKNK